MTRDNVIQEKSYAFALRIIKLYKHLTVEKSETILARQVLKSGTSIGANVEEALQAESRPDFIHKLSIANKEAHETRYWLMLLRDSEILTDDDATNSIIEQCIELIKLLTSIINTSKNRNQTSVP